MPFGGQQRWLWAGLLTLILAGSAALLIHAAYADSMTNDEGIYIHSGVCAFHARVIDLEATNPAGFKLLAGLGAVASGVPTDHRCESFSYRTLTSAHGLGDLRRLTFFSRLPAIAVTLCLILACAIWARALGGRFAGLLAAAFVGFDPTVIANGHIATGDMPLCLGIVGCLAASWRWTRDGGRRWAVLAGLGYGFALLNKASALVLLPLVGLIIFALTSGVPRDRLIRALRLLVPAALVAYVLLVVVYAPFKHTEPKHALLPTGLNWLIPESWLWGARWQYGHVRGSADSTTYLNGKILQGGSLLYFPEALLLKVTIFSLIAFLLGNVVLLVRRHAAAAWCLLPAAIFFVSAAAAGINIGVRYIEPTIVLLAVGAAVGIAQLRRAGSLRPARSRLPIGSVLAIGTVVACIAGPVGSIGYFNLLATRRHSYYLSDSNIDFGQDGWRLRQWWERAGRPKIQVDMFGYLPARYYVPTARDIGVHGERLDDTAVPQVPGRILIVSITSGNDAPAMIDAVAAARCHIGTGLVIIGATDCRTGTN